MKNSNSLGQTPFHMFLCGLSTKYSFFFFFSPVHLTFACKFKSELASFSPEGTISNENTATKENSCRGVSLQCEDSNLHSTR